MSRRSRAVGPTVLTLDRALHDPILAAVLAQRAQTPGWLSDQIHAARDEAVAVSQHAVDVGLYSHLEEGFTRDLPDWIRLGAFTALVEWMMGQGSTCMHSPHHDRPEPVYAAAWRPGLVVCSRCPHLFMMRHRSERDRTCDACGRVVAGLDVDDPIKPYTVHIINLAYSVGTCRGCAWT